MSTTSSSSPSHRPAAPGTTEQHQGHPTLASLLATAAGEALDLLAAPRGSHVPVHGVGVFDAGETFTAHGQVLLAPGTDDSSDTAPLVLRSAARAGAAAVVVRRGAGGAAPRLLEVAAETGTALLTRAPWVEWTELIGMLRAGLAHAGGPPAGESSTDVPLGDLPALARALSALVGGAITIEDPDSRVLAFSPTEHGSDPLRRQTILGQQVPRWRLAELTASGFLRTLWSTDEVVHRPAEGQFSERLAVAVRAGDEVLGSIWAAADGSPLREAARQALREAARTAAPHLLRHRQRTQYAAAHRRRAVQDLLEGTGDADSAAALGLTAETPCVVLSVTTRGAVTTRGGPPPTADQETADQEGEPPDSHDRALRLASLQATAHQPTGHPLRDADRLDVLLPLPDEDPPEADTAARRLALRLAAAVRDAGALPLVAIGTPQPAPAQAPRSRTSAHLVLHVLRDRSTRAAPGGAPEPLEVADETDVRAALDALRAVHAVAGLTPQVDGPVRELLAHDAQHGTALAPTLAAYLSRFGDVPGTARELGVHPNTLRYRLRRLRTRFGLDLDDPDVRLLAELGLRAAGRRPAAPQDERDKRDDRSW
ncbi:PucR family transcriptional regulator [Streptomyces qinglanensis]|uniref:DNA-binding transcriptional regulator, PucR family n=1 Tax=Streptomyces qinglanensis TaxID=943816 RepID=A0A1H9RTR1_9ACTN|nr:helix-turn-helix domain-containing protein [Streptomyces qinglanensis]SER76250.1 DNA-binding transcriptional regulator, PucR family [Streptomyces qinglanensis]